MIHWYVVPFVLVVLVLMVTFWIATTREAHCELLAATFLIFCTPVLIFLWCIFYLLSFIP
jgi:hypothetical protein